MLFRSHAPQGEEWDKAVEVWKSLQTDAGAEYDALVELDANELTPMITYGTHPGMGMPIAGTVPTAADVPVGERFTLEKALTYMDVEGGKPLLGKEIDVVFLGSCTNSRITDLRQAAKLLDGHKVADNVRFMVVPGSQKVKKQAEKEGLDKIFMDEIGRAHV